jgi:hypothetical protein
MDQSLLARLASQRRVVRHALRSPGRGIVYAYLREKDSPRGRAGTPYYVGVAGVIRRPYSPTGRSCPPPTDARLIRVLRADLTYGQALAWEQHFIQVFGRQDTGTGRRLLRNRTDGGEGCVGRSLSRSTRAKISTALSNPSPETRAKRAEAKRARPVTAETRAKLSAAARKRSGAGSAQARNNALRHGVDPAVWAQLTPMQRDRAVRRSREQGSTVAAYVLKMSARWGV